MIDETKHLHTPGPWYVTEHADRFDVHSGDRYICEIPARLTPDYKKRGRADAYLISAAPDLLEFAEMVLDWHTNKQISLRDIAAAGRRAIDKARGES